MSFRNRENYRIPEFCADCPVVAGMETIEIRKTVNKGFEVDVLCVASMPADPVIYAHDPDRPELGAVDLGRDYFVDPFCDCCEEPSSRALGQAQGKAKSCDGPVAEKGLFGRNKKPRCGADFREVGQYVTRLNRMPSHALNTPDNPLNVLVEKTARLISGIETSTE